MTDEELLRAAAKAAGFEIAGWFGDSDDSSLWFADIGPDADVIEWNPLRRDGDALRLAVKLHIHLEPVRSHTPPYYREVHAHVGGNGHCFDIQAFGGDPYAATRRAIVRAAAAMAGESK